MSTPGPWGFPDFPTHSPCDVSLFFPPPLVNPVLGSETKVHKQPMCNLGSEERTNFLCICFLRFLEYPDQGSEARAAEWGDSQG